MQWRFGQRRILGLREDHLTSGASEARPPKSDVDGDEILGGLWPGPPCNPGPDPTRRSSSTRPESGTWDVRRGSASPLSSGSQSGLADSIDGLLGGEALELQLVDEALAAERHGIQVVLRASNV